ncbi:N-ethylmaleimide reductase, partial [Penicillium waksmanii]|uniref:N-ethylmaleimide reductase n=1 Tax=Penicillium waksmanii TaxID=69791 RepID=UPI00254858AF
DQFHFITIQAPTDRTRNHLARSHAIARGLQNKRKLRQKAGLNFNTFSPKNGHRQPISTKDQDKPCTRKTGPSLACAADLLQMLAAESPKQQPLLNQQFDRQAIRPMFSVSDELVLRNFHSVLQNGSNDNALLSAVLLTFSFSFGADNLNTECLGYQSQSMSYIRDRMSYPEKATTESTLGAILLLARIEALLGIPNHVQLHMSAIKEILGVCQRLGVYLSDGIKRAIFWSDLNASVMTGSHRIVDHTTFAELQWRRDPFAPDFFILPPGFQEHSVLLGEGFLEILRDIFALQCIRDSALFGHEDVISMAHIDNHQASIQSRLVSLPSHSSISECCHLAAYLCSAMLRCKIWRCSTLPIQSTNNHPLWDTSPDLLAWLLHIGGAFAPVGSIRAGYMALVHSNHNKLRKLYTSWSELLEILKRFIWSEKAFAAQVESFWEESSPTRP